MQTDGSKGTGLAEPADPGLAPGLGAGIARGAAVVAGLTVLSRLLGLVRTLVFSQTVGAGCLGAAYVTANQVPNLLYELVLGGALTSAMVPVLARSAERAAGDPAEKARVGDITSALLTWTVIIVVPLVVVIAAAAGPIASLLTPANPNAHCARADVVAATGTMLVVFAPQALLYGLSVVLYGLLQSYRRFAAPSVGPGISSLVLIACYLAFVPLSKGRPLAGLPLTAELVLAAGTTLGIAVLVLVAVPPTWRLHLRFRPVLRFPPGVARRAGGLALVGFGELVVIELASVVAIVLANGRGQTGAIVLYNYAWQVTGSVSAVLALSIVISAFPVLSARAGPAFDRTSAGSTRAVLLMSWLGTAVIAAIAIPAGHVLASQPGQVTTADPGLRPVRSRHRGHRRDHEPVAGDVRPRAAQGRRGGAGRKLAARDRGRRGADRAGPAPPGGRRTGPGYHHRPDRHGDPDGVPHPEDLRQGRRAGRQPRGAGRAGRRRGGSRGGRGRQPGRARASQAGRLRPRGARGRRRDHRVRRRRLPPRRRRPEGRPGVGAAASQAALLTASDPARHGAWRGLRDGRAGHRGAPHAERGPVT